MPCELRLIMTAIMAPDHGAQAQPCEEAQAAEFDFAKSPPLVSIIASGMPYGCSRVPNNKGFLAKV